MVAERLFGWSSHPRESSYPQRGQPAWGPLPTRTPEHILGTNIVMALLVAVGQWRMLTALKWCTKSGNGHCRVLQSCWCSTLAVESSGLNWMIKLSWTAILCYRRAFSVMCFRRSAAAWQGARGERLIRLPSCCRAVKMRMTGSISCCRKRTYGPPLQPGVLSQRRSPNRSLVKSGQAKHLWMEVKLRWRVLADRMYTKAPTEKSKEELDALLLDRAARRNHTNPYEEKPYRGAAIKEVQAWWRQCKEWMAHFKGQSAPLVFDFKSLLKALSGKEAEAQSEVDAFMEHCAKRWQTREGTYQLKRRRLKPDVRDPPEDISADVDMADI